MGITAAIALAKEESLDLVELTNFIQFDFRFTAPDLGLFSVYFLGPGVNEQVFGVELADDGVDLPIDSGLVML